MQFEKVIISCGAAKITTTTPVQAWQLYTGGYYKKMFRLAVRMAPEVLILSAGYGILNVNDMVETYDIRMNNKLAKYYKDNKLVNFSGGSLLGKVYEKAITGSITPIIPAGIGGMGCRMQYASNTADNLPIIADCFNLPNGELKELIAPKSLY